MSSQGVTCLVKSHDMSNKYNNTFKHQTLNTIKNTPFSLFSQLVTEWMFQEMTTDSDLL